MGNTRGSGSRPTDRAAPIKAFRKRPLSSEHLQRAGGDVVRRSIAQYVIKCSLLWYIATALANDYTKLGFVVAGAVLGALGYGNCRRVGIRESRAGFSEEDWSFGKGHAGLL